MTPLEEGPVPNELQEPQRTLFLLNRARRNARTALANRDGAQTRQAFREVRAALVSSSKTFGIGDFSRIEAMTYRILLKIYLEYLDSFVPILEAGHIQEARRAAIGFASEGD